MYFDLCAILLNSTPQVRLNAHLNAASNNRLKHASLNQQLLFPFSNQPRYLSNHIFISASQLSASAHTRLHLPLRGDRVSGMHCTCVVHGVWFLLLIVFSLKLRAFYFEWFTWDCVLFLLPFRGPLKVENKVRSVVN